MHILQFENDLVLLSTDQTGATVGSTIGVTGVIGVIGVITIAVIAVIAVTCAVLVSSLC